MEPATGIEPVTDGLQNRCSAAELSWPKVRADCTTFAGQNNGFGELHERTQDGKSRRGTPFA
jgi:hypothetical protein